MRREHTAEESNASFRQYFIRPRQPSRLFTFVSASPPSSAASALHRRDQLHKIYVSSCIATLLATSVAHRQEKIDISNISILRF